MPIRNKVEQLKIQGIQATGVRLIHHVFFILLLSAIFFLPSCNQQQNQATTANQIILPDSAVLQAAEKLRGSSPSRDSIIDRLEKHTTLDSEYLALLFWTVEAGPRNLPFPIIFLGHKLIEAATQLNINHYVYRGANVIANHYFYQLQQYDSAVYYFEKVAAISTASGNIDYSGYANRQIGNLYASLGDFKKAIPYQLKAIKEHTRGTKPYERFDDMNQLAGDYIETGDFIRAQEYSRKSYKYYTDKKDTLHLLPALSILGIAKRGLNEWDSASYYSGLYLSIDKSRSDYLLGGVLDEFARIEYHNGNLKKALEYEERAFAADKKAGITIQERGYVQYLSMLYKKAGNINKALFYKSLETELADSLTKKQNTEAVVTMQNKFRFEQQTLAAQKENDLKQLAAAEQLNAQRLQKYLFAIGSLLLLLVAVFIYHNFTIQRNAKNRIAKEEQRSADLLHNILPEEVAAELKEKGTANARLFDEVTVLFTDFVGFTNASERLTPQQLVDELHACFSAFDAIMAKYNIEKIKTVGDAYLAVAGLPLANNNHAVDLVNAAIEIRNFMLNRKQEAANSKVEPFEIRIGVHSGSVVAGIVGVKKFAYDIWGDTVNTAARMEQNSEAGKINISQTTYELVKDKFNCEYRGEIEAKNKGLLKMYFVN